MTAPEVTAGEKCRDQTFHLCNVRAADGVWHPAHVSRLGRGGGSRRTEVAHGGRRSGDKRAEGRELSLYNDA